MFLGSIPKEFGNLTDLYKLSLEENELTGPLPRELGKLKNLNIMDLGSNYFTGSIPSTFIQLTDNLTSIDISGNYLSGSIPQFIGKLKNLRALLLVGNNFEGKLHEEIFSLPNLRDLSVSGLRNPGVKFPNQLKSKEFSILILRNCSINGTIPSYIAQWTELTVLDLSFNNLIGAIPKLVSGVKVFLTRNKFNETFPSWITKAPESALEYMDLSFNNFRNATNGTLLHLPNIIIEPTSDRYKEKACPIKYDSLSINCGGEAVKFENENYEQDKALSNFYESLKGNWAYSFSGNYGSDLPGWIAINSSDYINNLIGGVSFPEAQLYANARVAPMFLTYYAFCLHKAKYNIKLYFAETVFSKMEDHSLQHKRIFDVYVQGKNVLTDFNIKKEAGIPNKNVVKTFTTTITENEPLRIDFFSTGKGSSEDTVQNGPLISAISITRVPKVPRKFSAWEITAIVVACILALIIFLAFLWRMGWIGDRELHTTRIELGAQSYSVKEIINATQNFSSEKKIGKNGRFGIVYKAQLRNITVAVKKLFPESKAAKEVIAEVSALSKLENQNLVKLMGYYSRKKLHLLIYEHMDNGSLEQVLFGSNRQLQLNWETRYKICQQIAQGLEFLHKKDPPIIHRNIKASNVLLDANCDAKISDFALAKLYEEEDPFMFTKAGSTLMYMAPEYASHRNISVRVDVYSFGILLLEIVSGIKIDQNLGDHNCTLYLLEKADRCHKQKKYQQLVDDALEVSATTSRQATTIINLAMLCTEQLPSNRPSMSDVVNVLQGDLTVKDITEKTQSVNESSSQVLAANESTSIG